MIQSGVNSFKPVSSHLALTCVSTYVSRDHLRLDLTFLFCKQIKYIPGKKNAYNIFTQLKKYCTGLDHSQTGPDYTKNNADCTMDLQLTGLRPHAPNHLDLMIASCSYRLKLKLLRCFVQLCIFFFLVIHFQSLISAIFSAVFMTD